MFWVLQRIVCLWPLYSKYSQHVLVDKEKYNFQFHTLTSRGLFMYSEVPIQHTSIEHRLGYNSHVAPSWNFTKEL